MGTRDRLLLCHHLKMIKMDTKKKIVIMSSLIMIVTDVVFIVLTYTTQHSDEQSSPINLVKKSSENWSNVLIGMFLVIIVNSLVVIGIVFNIHLLLIPWQFLYILGILSLTVMFFINS